MKKLKEKYWTDENTDKLAEWIAIAALVLPFLLIIGIAGGIEMGTINFPWW